MVLRLLRTTQSQQAMEQLVNKSEGRSHMDMITSVTADISMLSLELNSVSSERYCSDSAVLSKSSFNSFVSY